MILAGAESSFESFGRPHLAAMAVIAAAAVLLSAWANYAKSGRLTEVICRLLASALIINELVRYIAGAMATSGAEFLQRFLPLHICGAAVYLTVWVLLTRGRRVFEIAYFWALGGTLQAILTPDLDEGFPSYWFFAYFIAHGSVVVGVVFAAVALKLRPRPRSILLVIVVTNLYMGVVGLLDWLLGANYMFLRRAPEGASPFFFLPWPWYIVFLEFLGTAFVLVLYLPFYIRDKLEG